MTLRIRAKVLLHVWSYDFYDMTLSTEKQRRHIINKATVLRLQIISIFHGCMVWIEKNLSRGSVIGITRLTE